VYGLTSHGASSTSVGGKQFEMDGNPIEALLALAVKAVTDAAKAEAQKQLAKLDQAVTAKGRPGHGTHPRAARQGAEPQ